MELFWAHFLSWDSIFLAMTMYIVIILLQASFFTPALADDLSLMYEWQQVSRTLLKILVGLNNAVVLMVSISNSTSPLTKSLGIVPSIYQLQLVSPSPYHRSIVCLFFVLFWFLVFGNVQVFTYPFVFSVFHSVVRKDGKIQSSPSSFSLSLSLS